MDVRYSPAYSPYAPTLTQPTPWIPAPGQLQGQLQKQAEQWTATSAQPAFQNTAWPTSASYSNPWVSTPNVMVSTPTSLNTTSQPTFWTRPDLAWPSRPSVAWQPPQTAYPQQVVPNQAAPVQPLPQPVVQPKTVKEASPVSEAQATPAVHYPSELKKLMQNNQSVMYALHLRTFGAEDKNKDGKISMHLGESGTFLNSIKHLDELQALGINTIHLLPIQPPGHLKRLGEAGSVYAPKTYLEVNQEYDTPNNGLSVVQEARMFVEEAHKRGMHVMVDVPSCASHDLAMERPDLIALDLQGNPLVPTNWIDILMFQNGPALVDYYDGFFDLMVNQVGVDGFRVDVARARPTAFWDHFIQKYPNHAWLAESYTQEDASPMENIPRDIPESLLKVGFDSVYGQFHIFHSMDSAYDYLKYLVEGNAMLKRAGVNKSFIGSFLTHDDHSLMENGGATMYFLVSGLMATQPWTNPYILDGFTTGYDKPFDIFNFRPRPKGQHPEIGKFLQHMLKVRKQYSDIVTQGLFIPIPLNQKNSKVVAFARHHQGKTLLVVANKDVNARSSAILSIPGLKASQKLVNLAPSYGRKSELTVDNNGMKVDLGPGRFHMFEIDTPELPLRLNSYR